MKHHNLPGITSAAIVVVLQALREAVVGLFDTVRVGIGSFLTRT